MLYARNCCILHKKKDRQREPGNPLFAEFLRHCGLRGGPPRFASLPERASENIKYSLEWQPNPLLQSTVCAPAAL